MSTVYTPEQENPRLDAALRYARRGWPVLPLHAIQADGCTCGKGKECTSAGKHPWTRHGVKDATTDEYGEFEFKDVPAGEYQLTATRSAKRIKGAASVLVKVENGKVIVDPEKVEIKLRLK